MMRKKIPEFKEKLDAVLVKRSAKSNKPLQLQIVSELLDQQKKDLLAEAPHPQHGSVSCLAKKDNAGVRKSSTGGSTMDEVAEEPRPCQKELQKDESPFNFFPEAHPENKLEPFNEDLPSLGFPQDFPTNSKPMLPYSIRPADDDLFDEWVFGRLRQPNPYSRDHSFHNSHEKQFTLNFPSFENSHFSEY